MKYTLKKDGDSFEKRYWDVFLKKLFPSYGDYWSEKVTPLTNRPNDIHFKSSTVLTANGHTPEEICLAQIHYTVFKHLVRSYYIINHFRSISPSIFDSDMLAEGIFHITGAQDLAFEFLQRLTTPNVYDPWAPKKSQSNTNSPASQEAIREWQKNHSSPLQTIKDYRNHLTHGRMLPNLRTPNKALFPKLGKQNNYLDWRIITDGYSSNISASDFDTPDNIVESAWNESINYFETNWKLLI